MDITIAKVNQRGYNLSWIKSSCEIILYSGYVVVNRIVDSEMNPWLSFPLTSPDMDITKAEGNQR